MKNKTIPYHFIDQLKKLSFIEEIWLFGSRSRSDHLERSDIDIAILCPSATQSDWLKVIEIVEKADTLLKIDLVRFDTIKDVVFKKRIEKEKIILYRKNHAQ